MAIPVLDCLVLRQPGYFPLKQCGTRAHWVSTKLKDGRKIICIKLTDGARNIGWLRMTCLSGIDGTHEAEAEAGVSPKLLLGMFGNGTSNYQLWRG
jgi:hypothetical protein